MALTIGALAGRAGLTVRTLHHYDAIGLLRPSGRSGAGYRLYEQADVMRLHAILALRGFGCSLAAIREALAGDGIPLPDILDRQMEVLDAQVRQGQVLRERLAWLRERTERNEVTGLGEWLAALEMMHMYERYFTSDELAVLGLGHRREDGRRLDREWRELAGAIKGAMARDEFPDGALAQVLARRWLELVRETTGNDMTLALKLKLIRDREARVEAQSGISAAMFEWMQQAVFEARLAIFARHLTPSELDTLRRNTGAQQAGWPPLVIRARQAFARGAAVDDPDVRALAHDWQRQFLASFAGGDPVLAAKIRRVYQLEPELSGALRALGMDDALDDFLERAGAALDRCGETTTVFPTALTVAWLRAAHQVLDAPPIFADPFAFALLTPEERIFIQEDPGRFDRPPLRGVRASLAVRAAWAEEAWREAHGQGTRQYVLLGAGLDTFAWRNTDAQVRIFEVDRPAFQAFKRERLRLAGLPESGWPTFVPLDLEHRTLLDSLALAGFDAAAPAFFAWLGVTMYLEEATVRETLGALAGLGPGTTVVFDYAVAPQLLSPRERAGRTLLTDRTAAGGEPWKSAFDPAALTAALRTMGFVRVEDLDGAALSAKYLAGREDALRKSNVTRLCLASM